MQNLAIMQKIVQLYVINGSGGTGKDTFVSFYREAVKEADIKVVNISTVDIIKEAAALLGCTSKKRPEDRKFLSDLKDLATAYSDHSFNYVVNTIAEIENNDVKNEHILFVHCREPEEIQRILDYAESKDITAESILLTRKTNIEYTNLADQNVNDFCYDYYVDNNSTLENLNTLAEFVRDIFFDTNIKYRDFGDGASAMQETVI